MAAVFERQDINEAQEDDDSEEHLDDIDFDASLHRLGAEAMEALNSLTDEVDAIDKGGAGKASVYLSPYEEGSDMGEIKLDAAGRQQPKDEVQASQNSLKHIDDVSLSDEDSDDDDGMSLDGSIAGELDALRMVAQEIEKELKFQDGETMKKAMENLQNPAVDPKKRILTSDDHEIIRRALYDEMKKYEPKNEWERFMKRYHLEGFSNQDKMYALLAICTVVWSIVLRLTLHVKFGEML